MGLLEDYDTKPLPSEPFRPRQDILFSFFVNTTLKKTLLNRQYTYIKDEDIFELYITVLSFYELRIDFVILLVVLISLCASKDAKERIRNDAEE